MLRSLVGSEMCIRDRCGSSVCASDISHRVGGEPATQRGFRAGRTSAGGLVLHSVLVQALTRLMGCLLYTSDAADDLLCVDLGGRRII